MNNNSSTSTLQPCILSVLLLMCISGIECKGQLKDIGAGDGIMIGSGIVIDLLARSKKVNIREKNKSPWGIDKRALNRVYLNAKSHSDIALKGIAPLTLLGSQIVIDDPGRSVYISLETILINDILNVFTKKIVRRPRPFTRNELMPNEPGFGKCMAYNKSDEDAYLSFYSGHTAHVAGAMFLTSTIMWYYNADFRNNSWLWYVGAAIPAMVGYQRIRAGKHFPTDVLVGYTVGAAVGYLVPKWHEDTNAIQTLDTSDLQENMILSSLSGIALLAILSRTLGKDDKHCDCCIKTSQIPKKNKWRLTPVTSYYTGLRLTYAL
ncbi:MAG: phosphatase PAP2 family protein [Bacteroidota bacterium]